MPRSHVAARLMHVSRFHFLELGADRRSLYLDYPRTLHEEVRTCFDCFDIPHALSRSFYSDQSPSRHVCVLSTPTLPERPFDNLRIRRKTDVERSAPTDHRVFCRHSSILVIPLLDRVLGLVTVLLVYSTAKIYNLVETSITQCIPQLVLFKPPISQLTRKISNFLDTWK
jgi:hypothetical protein